MLCASQNKINAKTTANRNCLIPNRSDFGPLEAVVFESVVIRAAFPSSQGACKARRFLAAAVETRQPSKAQDRDVRLPNDPISLAVVSQMASPGNASDDQDVSVRSRCRSVQQLRDIAAIDDYFGLRADVQ